MFRETIIYEVLMCFLPENTDDLLGVKTSRIAKPHSENSTRCVIKYIKHFLFVVVVFFWRVDVNYALHFEKKYSLHIKLNTMATMVTLYFSGLRIVKKYQF